MGLSKENIYISQEVKSTGVTIAKKRRLRRKKLKAARAVTSVTDNTDCQTNKKTIFTTLTNIVPHTSNSHLDSYTQSNKDKITVENKLVNHYFDSVEGNIDMSSKGGNDKNRDEILAAREAKKLAKQKSKKSTATEDSTKVVQQANIKSSPSSKTVKLEANNKNENLNPSSGDRRVVLEKNTVAHDKNKTVSKSKDEVDKAAKTENEEISLEISKDLIKAERTAKKATKHAKKKGALESGAHNDCAVAQPKHVDIPKSENLEVSSMQSTELSELNSATEKLDNEENPPVVDVTVKDMVNTLKDIVNVARDVQAVTDKVKAINLGPKKEEESGKSKAELRAERRAKQEAQRAAKQAAQQQKAEVTVEPSKETAQPKEEKSSKPKAVDKVKAKSLGMEKMNWFQHLYVEHDKDALKQMQINSNLHPAVIKLGIQLVSRVVTGSNARCIALMDALKKMVRDYSLPARTEFARGLEAQLAASADFLRSARPPAAAMTNALKYFRHHLTQLPNNVDEFDAKKRLLEEIDRYIHEQIDTAGEAISAAVRQKISDGDNILTYGCSSLIERILCEAHAARVRFRAVVVGARQQRAAREMLRRLAARGVRCAYADVSALGYLMRDMSKVLIGAASLLANGAVLAPVGALPTALVARAHNVPLLVACETHKFSDAVQTDAFVYNEIGDPDDLIDKSDENSPLKDWRSNPNLTLLNLTYDVTPPSLVTAVVTELAILPCTSAPVVLRFKLI